MSEHLVTISENLKETFACHVVSMVDVRFEFGGKLEAVSCKVRSNNVMRLEFQ